MQIDNSIRIRDYMTQTMQNIIHTMNRMTIQMNALNTRARTLGQGAFNVMRHNIISALASLKRMAGELLHVDMAQQRALMKPDTWKGNFEKLAAFAGKLRSAFGSLSKVMNFGQGYTDANAKLGMANDGLRTQRQLQDQLAASANRARAGYQATAGFISNIGGAGSTADKMKFAEQVNKTMALGSGDTQKNEAALSQLGTSLSSDGLDTEGLNSMMQSAPAFTNMLSEGLGVSTVKMQQMAAEGKLTTDTIMKAMNKMEAEIEGQFGKLPVSFSQNVQMMRDTIGTWVSEMTGSGGLRIINDLFAELNGWLASDSGQEFLQILSNGLYGVAYMVQLVAEAFSQMGGFLDMLGPVADALFYGLLIGGAAAAASALWAVVAPIAAIAGSFLVAFWPVTAIGAAVAGLILWLNHLGVTANDILTFIGGIIGGLAAFIVNKFIFVYNIIATVADFIGNIFIDPVYAVKRLFYDMVSTSLEFLTKMVNGAIAGINWLINMANKIIKTDFKPLDEWTPKNPLKEPTSTEKVIHTARVEYVDPKAFGKGMGDFLTGLMPDSARGSGNAMPKNPGGYLPADLPGEASGLGGTIPNVGQIGEVGKIGQTDSDINIAKEDLKYLLDATTQKYVNEVNLTIQTQAPVINNNATIREEADLEQLSAGIAQAIVEKTAVSSEG